MKDWKKYWGDFWETYPAKAGATEYFRQVGKTVNGRPISQAQFETLIADITELLSIQHDDIVLDLCCGNGIITREIGLKCQQVIGVDFSEPLIQLAKENAPGPNVKFRRMDVRQIRRLGAEYTGYFTKVLWYESLAFFDTKDLEEILSALTLITRTDAAILIGSVLDAERKWNFFNTPQRKLMYLVKIVLLGKEVGLGKWWKKKEIAEVSKRAGYRHEFLKQSADLHTAHYRMDVKLTRLTAQQQ